MDSIRRPRPKPEPIVPQAILDTPVTHKPIHDLRLSIAALLLALLPLIMPHEAFAATDDQFFMGSTVFEVGDHIDYVQSITDEVSFEHRHETAVQKLRRQMKMEGLLRDYLVAKRSPLADYTPIILQQNNWKKILALSNAESTMCRRYIEATANCWGVGGSDLWDMGENLGEGVVAMNNFLNAAPMKSKVKYSQMNFDQMNGLYKQPPRDHWVYNNLQVYNELTALERSAK